LIDLWLAWYNRAKMRTKRSRAKRDYDQPLKAIFEADPDGVLQLLKQQAT